MHLSPPSRGSVTNDRPKEPLAVISTVQVSLPQELKCGECMPYMMYHTSPWTESVSTFQDQEASSCREMALCEAFKKRQWAGKTIR